MVVGYLQEYLVLQIFVHCKTTRYGNTAIYFKLIQKQSVHSNNK